MLEIRRGIAKRSYENVFFREFSKNLAEMFEKYSIEGLLIGNSECELLPTLQIDALLITNKAICIIDFKNYEGEINLPSTSNFSEIQWTTKGNIIVRGVQSSVKKIFWMEKSGHVVILEKQFEEVFQTTITFLKKINMLKTNA